MLLRISLVCFYPSFLLKFLTIFCLDWNEFIKDSEEFMDEYDAGEKQAPGSLIWRQIRRKLYKKMVKMSINITDGEMKMNFLEATAKARDGKRMRRKEWLPGGSSAWEGKLVYVWWDAKYKCLLAAGPYVPIGGQSTFKDTAGYPYVCEGNDMEAKDWELAAE